MTNLEYYGIHNLEFESFALNEDTAGIRVDYKPKHAVDDENIVLFSTLVDNDRKSILNAKAKWLLREFEPLDLDGDDLINADFLYIPRHAEKIIV